ncbi:ion transporter [Aliiruegeria lutimaris]|uniref:Voltage-gated sodium channel n=1 Tax=Aliiruegeria lutimaris TaxID=571298 RepID=A0A1G8NFK2_9RHOB|nr:ion transporter [Aliiruegeria lutimaris]SDI78963.1 voltage-gated sodium channel [Aliiruegeria lutimaris]
MRATLTTWLERPATRNLVIGVIIFNAILLGLETYPAVMDRAGGLIIALDYACLTIFVIEITAKLIAYRFRFFRSPWNIFDFVIVGIALIPAAHAFSVLRALRILRVLRVISALPRLRRVVEGFISALPGMGSVFLLMGLVFYIGAVMSTKLYGESFPEWFGSLGRSLYSLFQIMTLESWSMGIVRPVMQVHSGAWLFFVPFILLTTFAVVNLLVGLIVNSMQDAHHEEDVEKTDAYRDEVLSRLNEIERHLKANAARNDAEMGREKAPLTTS